MKPVKLIIKEKLSTGSHNVNFIAYNKDIQEDGWVVKVSIKTRAGFKDLNERALLAYKLSLLAGVRLPETHIMKMDQVSGLEPFREAIKERVNDEVTITKYSGVPLTNFFQDEHTLKDLDDFEEIFRSFVFNVWIGNYDRKAEDYLISTNKQITSIDYQLCGPGFQKDMDLAIGAYALGYSLEDVNDTAWCLEGSLNQNIGLLLGRVRSEMIPYKVFLPHIETIQKIPEQRIRDCFEDISFYGQFDSRINEHFVSFLLSRREKIGFTIQKWVTDGYPIKNKMHPEWEY